LIDITASFLHRVCYNVRMNFGFNRQRWMPLLMQTFLWVVLLATLGAAEMVDATLRRWAAIHLTGEFQDGRISYRLPQHWKITDQSLGDTGVQHIATDLTPASTGRKLFISRQKLGTVMLPVQYLLATGQIEGDYKLDAGTQSIAGWPAQMVSFSKMINTHHGGVAFFSRICCFVLPSREAVELCMDKPGVWDAADDKLFEQIADAMDIIGLPNPKNETTRLSNGGIVPCPADFVLYPQADALETARQMVWQADGGKWISVDLIPLAKARQQNVAGLTWALARLELANEDADPAVDWLGAKVVPEGAGRWRIDPPQRADQIVRRRAFLAMDVSGQGLLVRMVATLSTMPDEMLAAWKTISKGMGFDKPVNVNVLLDATDSDLADMRAKQPDAGLPGGVALTSRTWWWLWSTNGVPSGWTNQAPDLNTATQQRVTVRRQWNDSRTSVQQNWGVDPENHIPFYMVDRGDFNGNGSLFLAKTLVNGRQLITRFSFRNGPIRLAETPAAAFVPGDQLPDILAKLPSRAMAFFTERFPGHETDPLTVPVLVLATPINANGQTRPVEATSLAWQVEVLGTGQISRWYFHVGGALDHAEFADDQRVRPSTQAEVTAAFADDPRLTPALR